MLCADQDPGLDPQDVAHKYWLRWQIFVADLLQIPVQDPVCGVFCPET